MLAAIFAGDLYTEPKRPYGGYPWSSLILIGRDWLLITLAAGFLLALAYRAPRSGRAERKGA